MQLNDALAHQIVSRAMKILSFSVNVMDERGLIIASGNPERLHQRHEGAVLALTENRVVEISEATARELKGVRPGINLPIAYQGSCSASSASLGIRTSCVLTPSWCA